MLDPQYHRAAVITHESVLERKRIFKLLVMKDRENPGS
jgi:hypothetical protein